MAEATYNDEGDRPPATYANFLIFNSVVLYSYLHNGTDLLAKALQDCFPNKELIGIDCRAPSSNSMAVYIALYNANTGRRTAQGFTSPPSNKRQSLRQEQRTEVTKKY